MLCPESSNRFGYEIVTLEMTVRVRPWVYGALAELVYAPVLETGHWGFESLERYLLWCSSVAERPAVNR